MLNNIVAIYAFAFLEGTYYEELDIVIAVFQIFNNPYFLRLAYVP